MLQFKKFVNVKEWLFTDSISYDTDWNNNSSNNNNNNSGNNNNNSGNIKKNDELQENHLWYS